MLRILTIGLLASAAAAGAQSLEQSYAQLCSGAAKSSETCATLRSALMDKLAKDGGTARPLKSAAATVKPGKVGPQWRVWGPVAGKTLVDENGDIHRFEWVERGAVLKSTRQTAAGEDVTRYELKTDGTVMALRDGRAPVAMEPSGKASFAVTTPGIAGERWRYSPSKGGIEIVQESLANGKWTATGKRGVRTVSTGAALARAETKLAEARVEFGRSQWKTAYAMTKRRFYLPITSGTSEDSLLTTTISAAGDEVVMQWFGLPSGNKGYAIRLTRAADGTIRASDSGNRTGTATLLANKVAIEWTSDVKKGAVLLNELVVEPARFNFLSARRKKNKLRDQSTTAYEDVTDLDNRILAARISDSLAQRKESARQQQVAEQNNSGGGTFGRMLGGALMGAMLGGGGQSSVDLAVAGAQAAANGGNTYEILTQMGGVAQASADQSKRELDATIARANAQAAEQREAKRREELAAADARATAAAQGRAASAASAAEAARLHEASAREAAVAKADAKRRQEEASRQQAAAAEKARRDEAARLAEAERNRPIDWKEGIVLCQQRPNSKEFRCPGPLQVNYVRLDAPNWRTEIGMACGSADGVRDIGMIAGYRAFGCGFGIHPTSDYPGNIDVPKQLGVFVSDRHIFHCPKDRDAYCRNP